MRKDFLLLFGLLLIYCLGFSQAPSVALASSNPAIPSRNLLQGVNDNIIYAFSLAVTNAPTALKSINFTTTNSAATDIKNYKLYYNTENELPDGSPLARITTNLGSGLHSLAPGSPRTLAKDSTYYFFITCDIPGKASIQAGNKLSVSTAIATADISFAGLAPVLSGAAFAGTDQFILANTSAPAKKDHDSSARDVSTNQFLYLNAANLDFSGHLSSNYVGHLNFYCPQPVKSGPFSFLGFNAGFMTLNYSNNDSVGARLVRENVLLDPLQTVNIGTKYLKQLNTYTIQIKQSGYSFYVQPLFQLTNQQSEQKVFLHGHMELFINKYTVTTSSSNVKQDSAVVDSSTFRGVFKGGIGSQTVNKNTFIDGYFGGGVTFDLQPYKSAEFIFQATLGWTTGTPKLSPYNSDNANQRIIYNTKKMSGFYLVRSYYIQKLTGMSTLIFGVDIRGFLPSYAPLYASYVGVNVALKDILTVIGINH